MQGGRPIRGRRIFANGRVEAVQASTRSLAQSEELLPRDLRLLATRGANIAVRPAYYICRFPPFSAVVTSKSVLLIDSPDDVTLTSSGSGSLAHKELVRLATDVLEGEVMHSITRVRGDDEHPLPFEHLVLDAVLREDWVRKQERFARLLVQTSLALAVRDPGSSSRRGLGLLALGADRHAEAREHALYQLITLSENLDSLQVEVRRAQACLDGLLQNDEDMAALYLSHRQAEGVARATEQHQEVELLLEGYGTQLMDLSDRIIALQGSVRVHRTLEELKLRNERNRIMRVDLLLSMGGISLTISAVVGGFFGMNLTSGVEDVPGLFWVVGACASSASVGLLWMLSAGIRRFHNSQRSHLLHMASLQRGLGSFDHAYYVLRHAAGVRLTRAHDGASESGPPLAPTVAEETLATYLEGAPRKLPRPCTAARPPRPLLPIIHPILSLHRHPPFLNLPSSLPPSSIPEPT